MSPKKDEYMRGYGEGFKDGRLKASDYSIDLSRIIEDLCHGNEIRTPKTTTRFHYDMAVAHRSRETEVRSALKSISANTCCDTCREAALVAQAAISKATS